MNRRPPRGEGERVEVGGITAGEAAVGGEVGDRAEAGGAVALEGDRFAGLGDGDGGEVGMGPAGREAVGLGGGTLARPPGAGRRRRSRRVFERTCPEEQMRARARGRCQELTGGGGRGMLAGRVEELDLDKLLASPELQAAGGLILALVIGYAISTALAGALARAAARRQGDLDEHLLALMRRPVWTTVAVVVLEWAGDRLRLVEQGTFDALLGTVLVVVWVTTLVRVGDELLLALVRRASMGQAGLASVSGRATGLVHFLVRVVLLLAGLYLVMVLWGLDVRVWQVSAGVAGAVLGFAAQDSLGNLISAVFLYGDAPLRIGDVIVVDQRLRGRVTDIGWRSTRVLTNDGVEVNLPNALLGSQRIVNESAGPDQAVRLACEFTVEFGRTAEELRAILLPEVVALPELRPDLPAELQLRGPTAAGLRFALLVYLADPSRRSQGLDVTNSHILRSLRAAGVALAYAGHDVRLGGPLAARLRATVVPGPKSMS